MAKTNKKAKQAKKATKARNKLVSAMTDAKGFDAAHKIWLAGVGAYGKAYDVATDGVGKVSDQSGVLFEDLVKRGEEIEGDVRARLKSNTAVAKMSEQMNARFSKVNAQVSKVRKRVKGASEDMSGTVAKFQEEQRERLDARMERMREALGLERFSGKAKTSEKLHAKLDDLEEQVAALRAGAEGADTKVKARIERLSKEISEAAEKPVKAAKKSAKKVVHRVKTAVAKADPMGRLKAARGGADDLTMIKGVGAVLQTKMNQAGIFHFWQLAALTKAQISALETDLNFPGRATREAWKSQAKAFAKSVAKA